MLKITRISRSISRASKTTRSCRTLRTKAGSHTRVAIHPYAQRKQQHFVRSVTTIATLGAVATAWQWYSGDRIFREVHAEEPPQAQETELEFEKPRRKAASKEDNRDIISSQHLQVKKSWENPGVYGWGSNSGKVAAPDSTETFIKTPRRIPFFDGMLLRDIKLDRTSGVAIDEKGDLLQWGTAFSKEAPSPVRTLRGKNLISLSISRDRILALSSSGIVYSLPISQAEQLTGPKPSSTSWIPFWNSIANDISYRTISLPNLSWNESITNVSSGLEHGLLLTSKGRLFSFASGTQDFPSKGQLGIPGLTWQTRPAGSYDQPHEITTLRGFQISKIATGDFHSLASDSEGRAFAFGDNTFGQLGFDYDSDAPFVDAPSLLPIQRVYSGTAQTPRVTNVFAGGSNSFFTVDATRTASPSTPSPRDLGRITADTLACGLGLSGQLGTGRYTHIQTPPAKIPALSGLFEYSEVTNSITPIRLSHLSVGATHVAAVMDNIPNLSASSSRKTTENDTNWGKDILFFGNNEFYQLGTGKRANVATPAYIQPLDQAAEAQRAGVKEMHRFHITPKARVKVGGRWVEMEQRVECGRGVTAVYSGV